MNRCPLCLTDAGDPLLGTDSGALLCSACSGLAPMDRLQLIAKVVVSTPPHESNLHRMGRLARWLATDGMKVVRESAKEDQVMTRECSRLRRELDAATSHVDAICTERNILREAFHAIQGKVRETKRLLAPAEGDS